MSPVPPVCAKCNEHLVGQIMSVGAERFHPGCFCCDGCGQPITGAFKIGEDGKRLCTECVPKVICQACQACIEGEVLNYGTKSYHPSCFKCHTCDKPIAGTVYPSGDHLHCEACAKGSAAEIVVPAAPAAKGTAPAAPAAAGDATKLCRKCKEPITGKMVLADRGDAFHEACFRCAECQGPMEQFVVDERRRFKHQDYCYVCKDCVEEKTHRQEGEEIMLTAGEPQWPGAPCSKAPAAGSATSARSPPCCICKEPCTPLVAGEDDCFQTLDGCVMHWKCFRCTDCGALERPAASASSSVLLRSKVNDLKKGCYRCELCQERARKDTEAKAPSGSIKEIVKAAPALPLGTYFGKAEETDDAERCSITLAKDGRCKLEVSTATTHWCVEGVYKEEGCRKGDGIVYFNVEKGAESGPTAGDVMEFVVKAGSTNKDLVHKGIACALIVGVPTFEVLMLHKRAAKAAVQQEAPQATPAFTGTLTLAELLNADVWKATGVDPGAREQHLSDSEFFSLFGMDKAAFLKLPKWKRDAKKKEHNLF